MILPLKAHVEYLPNFLDTNADDIYNDLVGISELTDRYVTRLFGENPVEHDFGKLMYVNQDLIEKQAFPEAIWGKVKSWPEFLIPVKNKIETLLKHKFDVGVCIYYPDGNSGVPYHSDLASYGDTNIIPSLSLGEEREFRLRELKTQKQHKMALKHGSLLVMGDQCQELYQHALPTNPKYKNPRVNITFRKYGFHP